MKPAYKRQRRHEEEISPGEVEEAIGRLNKEWEYFKETGKCPKCSAQILGNTQMHDEIYDSWQAIKCSACGKEVIEQGGAHLGRLLELQENHRKSYGAQHKSPSFNPG